MKKLLLLAGIFCCFKSFAQLPSWTPVFGHYEYKFIGGDSVLFTPGDTLTDAPINSLAIKGGVMYYKTSTHWATISGSGGGATWGVNITGDINTQTDLINLVNHRVNYTDTGTMLASYLRAALGVKYSDTGAMLTPYLRSALFTKANLGLGNVVNSLQVINYGGMTSIGEGTFASIPLPASGPTLWFASDTVAWYFNTGSSYVKASGSGGGGGSTDSSVYATRYYTLHNFYPLTGNPSSFLTAITSGQVIAALGFTPYSSTNPSGFITGNQTVTITPSGDIKGKASGSTAINPVDTVTGLENSPLPTLATGNLRYNSGWLFDNTHYYSASDTTATLATKSNIAAIGTPFVHYTDSASIYFTKYRSDTMRADLYAALALKVAYSDSGTIYQTKYRSDTGRVNIYAALATKVNYTDSATVYQTKYRSDSARANFYAGLAGKVAYTDSATIYQTKYRSDSARANVYAALAARILYSDSAAIYYTKYRSDTSRTAIYAALANRVINSGGVKNEGASTYASRPAASTVIGNWYVTDSLQYSYSNGTVWAWTTNNPNKTYHLYVRGKGSPGDTTLLTASDSTFHIAAIRDSLNFHHVANPDGSWTLYVTGGGGTGDTATIILAGLESPLDKQIITNKFYVRNPQGVGDTSFFAINDSLYAKADSAGYGIKHRVGGTYITSYVDSVAFPTLFAMNDSITNALARGGSNVVITTTTGLAAGSFNIGSIVITTDSGREGVWHYNSAHNAIASNGGLTIIDASTHAWDRFYDGYHVAASWFNIRDVNTHTLNTTNFYTMIPVVQNKEVYMGKGYIQLDSLNIQNNSWNIKFKGAGYDSTILFGTTTPQMFMLNNISGCTWEDLQLYDTVTDAAFDAGRGLIYSVNKISKNLHFNRVKFKYPNANAATVVFEVAVNTGFTHAGSADGIFFDDCVWDTTGQNNLAFLNRDSNRVAYDARDSMANIHIRNFKSKRAGVLGTDGSFITFDGFSARTEVGPGDMFDQNVLGIEYTGGTAGHVHDITTHGHVSGRPWATLGLSPFNPNYPMTNFTFENIFDLDSSLTSTAISGSGINAINNSTFSNIKLQSALGHFVLTNSNNNKFFNTQWAGGGATNVVLKSTTGFTTQGNQFWTSVIDNSGGGSNTTLITFDSVGTTQNIFYSTKLRKASGGTYTAQTNSATNNFFINANKGSYNDNKYVGVGMSDATTTLSSDIAMFDYDFIKVTGANTKIDTLYFPTTNQRTLKIQNRTTGGFQIAACLKSSLSCALITPGQTSMITSDSINWIGYYGTNSGAFAPSSAGPVFLLGPNQMWQQSGILRIGLNPATSNGGVPWIDSLTAVNGWLGFINYGAWYHSGNMGSSTLTPKSYVDSSTALYSRNMFSQTAQGSIISNSVGGTLTSILGTGIGSNVFAANSLTAGETFVIHGFAQYSATSYSGTMSFCPQSSGTLVSLSPLSTATGAGVEITMYITIVTTGASGTFNWTLDVKGASSTEITSIGAGFGSTINTTISNTIGVFVNYSTTSNSASIQSNAPFTIQKL